MRSVILGEKAVILSEGQSPQRRISSLNELSRKEYFRKYGIITAAVVEIVALILFGFFSGKFLDEKLGLTPYLMIAGVILGFIGGIYRFYRSSQKILK